MAKVLITYGGWDGHFPNETATLVADWLRGRDHDVVLSDTLDSWLSPGFDGIDVVIPMWTMGEASAEQLDAFRSAVLAGMGVAGFHGGMGDAFRAASDYQYIVGGQFVAHPGDKKRYMVKVTDPGDPIMTGITDFEVNSEQYYMHTDPSNHVLATTEFDGVPDPWARGVIMPVVWKRQYGEGRIFYCSIGHDPGDLENPPVREILVRGIEWAAR